MIDKRALFWSVVKSSTALVFLWFSSSFVLGLMVSTILKKVDSQSIEVMIGAIVTILPILIGSIWIFRNYKIYSSLKDALVVAISFAIFAPLSMIVALPVAELTGARLSYISPIFGYLGIVGITMLVIVVICFCLCFVILKIFRAILTRLVRRNLDRNGNTYRF